MDSKLLTIYNFYYLDHTYVNYHVSEKLYAKLKSTLNLEIAYFRSKTHYIHIVDNLNKYFFKLSK